MEWLGKAVKVFGRVIISLLLIPLFSGVVSATTVCTGYNGSLSYTLDCGVRRDTLNYSDPRALTYNVHTGNYPQVYDEGSGRLDLMAVNKPPRMDDVRSLFNYSMVKGEVAWAALTLNLSQANATIKFERTIDFTNVSVFNITRDVNLTFNYVKVNASTMQYVNKEAKIILNNLTFQSVKVLKGGSDCTDCTILSYEGGQAVFKVQPTLTDYTAVELAGWVEWNMIDLVKNWVGATANNKGVIVVGTESQDNTLRQYYSSNATNASLSPKLEVNYTITNVTMWNNATYVDYWDLDNYFYDPDGDPLSYTSSNDHLNISITIDLNDHTVDIMPLESWVGTQYVVFTGTDSRGGIANSNNVSIKTIAGVTTTTTTTTTTNAIPIVRAVVGQRDIVPMAGSIKPVTYNASVYDGDGCLDILTSSVKGILWNNVTAKHYDSPDSNKLYSNTSCTLTCNGNYGLVQCGFKLLYYAEPSTQWAINISLNDGLGYVYNITDMMNMSSLVGLNVTTSVVNFSYGKVGGALSLGETTSYDTNLIVQNIGNIEEDLLVNGQDLTCVIGTVPVANIKYYSSPGADYTATMCALTTNLLDTCSALQSSYNLAKRTTEPSPPQGTVYWKMKVPASGVGGFCNGTMNVGGWTT